MRSDFLNNNSNVGGPKSKYEKVSAAKTLSADDSGKVFGLDQDAAYSITLPKAADAGAGWNAKFILVDEGSNAVKVIPDSSEDTLIGMIVSADGAAGESSETGVDELVWVASTAKLGDWAELFCDGSNYYVYGQEHDADHMTLS
tara:strand:+ start:469 stop:900 length:432 start_codon:yes stop_codon:yes gene_type:complete